MGKKTNLKASLSSLQEKQRKVKLERAKAAARKDLSQNKISAVTGGSRPSAKSKGKRPAVTIPFGVLDTILLVGEGNFSFTRAIFSSGHEALTHLPPSNVTATAYDTEEECYEKYPDAKEIVERLRERGVTVLFGIDARKLGSYKELKKKQWKKIVWNFPHTGKGISDQDRNVLSNQVLLLDFLKSAAALLADGAIPSMTSHISKKKKKKQGGYGDEPDNDNENEMTLSEASRVKERGTILITLKNSPPYTLWDISRLAKKPPPEPHISSLSPSAPHARFVQIRSFAFRSDIWKGYEHRMTKGYVEGISRGHGGNSSQEAEDRTWEFCLADEE